MYDIDSETYLDIFDSFLAREYYEYVPFEEE